MTMGKPARNPTDSLGTAKNAVQSAARDGIAYVRAPSTLDEIVEEFQHWEELNHGASPTLSDFKTKTGESIRRYGANLASDILEVLPCVVDTAKGAYYIGEGLVLFGAKTIDGAIHRHPWRGFKDGIDDCLSDVAGSAFALARGGLRVAHGTYSGLRHLIDPVKPSIDRIVDTVGFMTASLAAMTVGFHYGFEALSNNNTYSKLLDYPIIDATVKTTLMTLTGIYAIRGFPRGEYASAKVADKGLWHAAKQISRRTKPGLLNYLKTVGILGSLSALYTFGIKDDLQMRWDDIKSIRNPATFWNATKNIAGTGYGYMLGGPVFRTLDQIVQDFGFETPPGEERAAEQVENSIEQVTKEEERRPRVIPPLANNQDPVVSATLAINKAGYRMTPEQAVYLTRVGYYEGAWDPRAKTNSRWDEAKMKAGFDAIFSVVRNRAAYDKHAIARGQSPGFTNSRYINAGSGPFGAAFKSGYNKRGVKVWQFTCVRDHLRQRIWHKNDGTEPNIPYNSRLAIFDRQRGRYQVAIGSMDPDIAHLALQSLTDVLSGRVADPTNGATHYQNPRAVDRNNTPGRWHRSGLRKTGRTVNSHEFWKLATDNGEWRSAIRASSTGLYDEFRWDGKTIKLPAEFLASAPYGDRTRYSEAHIWMRSHAPRLQQLRPDFHRCDPIRV